MPKVDELQALAAIRKEDRIAGHRRLSDFHDGAYDRHQYVSPWSISAHNPDAEIMVLLQDWSSTEMLEGGLDHDAARLGYTPRLATNKNLIALLNRHFKAKIEDTYVTNLFVFIKPGNISARVPMADAAYCARKYAIPQIEIVRPRVALCAGSVTFNALRIALGQSKVRLSDSLSNPAKVGPTVIYGVPHTGGLGTANAGGMAKVDAIWSAIAERHFSGAA